LNNEWIDYFLLAGVSDQWIPATIVTLLEDVDIHSIQDKRKQTIRSLVAKNPSLTPIGYNNSTPPDCDSSTWLARSLLSCGYGVPDHLIEYLFLHEISARGFSTYHFTDGIHTYIGQSHAQMAGWFDVHDCVTFNVATLLQHYGREQTVSLGWRPYWWSNHAIPYLLACESNRISHVNTMYELVPHSSDLPPEWNKYDQFVNTLCALSSPDSISNNANCNLSQLSFSDFGCVMQLPATTVLSAHLPNETKWQYGGFREGARLTDINHILSSALFLKVLYHSNVV
jgi:hypothetical protein